MPKPSIKSIWLELQIDPNDPELLATLDLLVRSNMLERAQILEIARTCLSEDLPWQSPVAALPDFEPELPPPLPKIPSPVETMWQTLKDELSVRWLLFLGVFLVVLSSGVLAATQWSRFPAWGQYGLLWLYTVGFWVVGGWARRQEGLRLTASTLQLVTMLLIPVNFWAIDSFGLWHQPLEFGIAIVAGVSLAGIGYLKQRRGGNKFDRSSLLMGAFLGLSVLHLGWQIPYWATIAIYIGAIGTAIILQKIRQIEGGALAIYGLGVLLLRGLFVAHLPYYTFGLAIGIVGWLFAQWSLQKDRQLARIERIQRLPLRLVRDRASLTELARLYRGLGASLLLLGWLLGIGDLVSAPKTSSWQAFLVSCLALVWIWQRLRKDYANREVCLLFFVGLETYIISSFLWSPLATGAIFAKVLPILISIFGQNYLVAGSLLIFPYLLFWVGLTGWFQRLKPTLAIQSPPNNGGESIAQTGELLILCTGALLPIVNLSNPLSLAIDAVISTAILAHLTLRRMPVRSTYIYLTNLSVLGTIGTVLYYRWDWCRSIAHNFLSTIERDSATIDLSIATIAAIGLTAIELWLSALPVKRGSDPWQRSCWTIGSILTLVSYCCFCLIALGGWIWPIWWLLVPIAFTYIATRQPPLQPWQLERQNLAAWYGIIALGAGLLATVNSTQWRSIWLIAAIGLMFFLVKRLNQILAAAIQIGFGLALGINLLAGHILPNYWLVVGAMTCGGLWLVSGRLKRVYAVASDRWAIGIAGVGLAIGSINYAKTDLDWFSSRFAPQGLGSFLGSLETRSIGLQSINFTTLVATGILVAAIVLGVRGHASIPEWVWFWSLSWAIEIGLGALVHLLGGDTLTLAAVNIFLAFPLWVWLKPPLVLQSPKNIIEDRVRSAAALLPYLIAGWGLILRLPFFTAYTGLLTIAVGWLGVLASRKASNAIGYIGLLLMTLGGYELVTYQMFQAPPGGNIADALTIYGVITAVLALGYRLGVSWHSHKGVDTWGDFPLAQLKNVAHLHWAVASTLKVAAATMPVVPLPKLTLLHLFISALLGGYALIQARDRQHNGDWWIYLGLAELLGVGVYARSIFRGLGVVDEGLILLACTIGLLVLLAPWRQWGWSDRPWRLVALVLPLSRVVFEVDRISLLNLAVLAIFYAGVAKRQGQFIWAYLSLGFINWAAMRLLFQYHLTSPIWYAILVGASILVAVQWDPYWQAAKQNRHYGRILGSGTIAITALVWHQPWLPIGIGLAIGIIGLILRVRAWFYVGTIAFILSNTYQLLILITEYPITKWGIGLLAGILIITLAANFEQRKEQIDRILRLWIDRLKEWE